MSARENGAARPRLALFFHKGIERIKEIVTRSDVEHLRETSCHFRWRASFMSFLRFHRIIVSVPLAVNQDIRFFAATAKQRIGASYRICEVINPRQWVIVASRPLA